MLTNEQLLPIYATIQPQVLNSPQLKAPNFLLSPIPSPTLSATQLLSKLLPL